MEWHQGFKIDWGIPLLSPLHCQASKGGSHFALKVTAEIRQQLYLLKCGLIVGGGQTIRFPFSALSCSKNAFFVQPQCEWENTTRTLTTLGTNWFARSEVDKRKGWESAPGIVPSGTQPKEFCVLGWKWDWGSQNQISDYLAPLGPKSWLCFWFDQGCWTSKMSVIIVSSKRGTNTINCVIHNHQDLMRTPLIPHTVIGWSVFPFAVGWPHSSPFWFLCWTRWGFCADYVSFSSSI